jgi:predicted HTH transcriptional regulator
MSAFTVSRYRRVVEDCQAGGYPVPEWEEYGPAVRVVFRPHPEVAAADEVMNVPVNVPINVPVNERQRWFLDQIAQGTAVKASDIAARFQVTIKTARRDLVDLKARQLIEYTGAPKKGFYRIKSQP